MLFAAIFPILGSNYGNFDFYKVKHKKFFMLFCVCVCVGGF